jgi:hypothetical protein
VAFGSWPYGFRRLKVCGCEELFNGCGFDGCKAFLRTPLPIISNLFILLCILAIFSLTVLDLNRYKASLLNKDKSIHFDLF